MSIRTEMTLMLQDYLLRRINLLVRGYLNLAQIKKVSNIMANQLGWSAEEEEKQVRLVQKKFPFLQ